MQEGGYLIQVCQLSGAPIARLRAQGGTKIGELALALCKKAGLEDGVLALSFDGKVLHNDETIDGAGLDNTTVLTAVRSTELAGGAALQDGGRDLQAGGNAERRAPSVDNAIEIYVSAAFEDGSTKIWSEHGPCKKYFEGRKGSMLSAGFTGSGLGVATGSMDTNAYLWNMLSGRCERYYQGHRAGVTCVACSPDGNLIATGSLDRLLILWDLNSGSCVCKLPDHRGSVLCVAFSSSGNLLCSGSEDYSARLWDVQGGDTAQRGETMRGHEGSVVCAAFTPDGLHVATGATDGHARIWNLKGKQRQLIQVYQPSLHANIGSLSGSPAVSCLAWSPDGLLLATGCSDGLAKVWDPRSNRCERTFEASPQRVVNVRSVEFSPGGVMLATGSEDGVVALWDVAGGRQRACLEHGGPGVQQVTFTPGPLTDAAEPRNRSSEPPANRQSRARSRPKK
mmetsp:Transcript_20264/g.53156  ORF Transcript_20264/g.53156 Transcript_20264/m.53156 type:complete len:452 (+) Transcript_20264:69-1424(+)